MNKLHILNCKKYDIELETGFFKNELMFDCPDRVRVRVRQVGNGCGKCITGAKSNCVYCHESASDANRVIAQQFNRPSGSNPRLPQENPQHTKYQIIIDPETCGNVPSDSEMDAILLKTQIGLRSLGDPSISFECLNFTLGGKTQTRVVDVLPTANIDERNSFLRVKCLEKRCSNYPRVK